MRAKYRRRLRQIPEHRGHERLARRTEERVGNALAPDRGKIGLADVSATERSGAVARMHFGGIGQREKLLGDGIVKIACELAHLVGAEEVRAADSADEQRVTGEHARIRAGLLHKHADVLRGVPRCMEEREADVANREGLAVANLVEVEVQIGARAGIRAGARSGELARPRHEIGMDVSFDCGNDIQLVLTGHVGIHIGIPARVHHHRLTGTVARQQV